MAEQSQLTPEQQKALYTELIYGLNPNADEAWILANQEQISAAINNFLAGVGGLISGIFDDIFD